MFQRKLDTAVLYRSNVRQRLELHVVSLDQLNSSLQLLEELRDMENKIDNIYLPIENMYDKLRLGVSTFSAVVAMPEAGSGECRGVC